jgi:hypothetical protein
MRDQPSPTHVAAAHAPLGDDDRGDHGEMLYEMKGREGMCGTQGFANERTIADALSVPPGSRLPDNV